MQLFVFQHQFICFQPRLRSGPVWPNRLQRDVDENTRWRRSSTALGRISYSKARVIIYIDVFVALSQPQQGAVDLPVLTSCIKRLWRVPKLLLGLAVTYNSLRCY
jgi:hypothetical protein